MDRKKGKHKVTTPKQQFLHIILCLFIYVFEMAVAMVFLCENAVKAIQISSISMIELSTYLGGPKSA